VRVCAPRRAGGAVAAARAASCVCGTVCVSETECRRVGVRAVAVETSPIN
jgi:hypothetical protein